MTKLWHFLFVEPFRWIFLAFFQPRRLTREFQTEYPRRLQRFAPLLQLIVPMFLTSLPIALIGRAELLSWNLESPDIANFFFFIVGGIALFIVGGIALFIVGGIALFIVFGIVFGIAGGIVNGLVGGIALFIVAGLVGGIAFGFVVDLIVNIVGGLAGAIITSLLAGIVASLAEGIVAGKGANLAFYYIVVGIAIGIFSMIGLFRIPLYLASGLSALKAYYASCDAPAKVFDYLHRCSLYWDELVYLPLPYLTRTLLIAYDESPQKVLEEIAFIVAARPQQSRAARAAVLEIVMRDLEQRDSLEKIAGVADWLTVLLPPGTKLIDTRGNAAIARMSDASRDAMRAIAPIGLQGRRIALDDFQANLRKVYPNAFRNQRVNARLTQVVARWRDIAGQKQEQLSRAAQDVGNIDNPYKPGQNLSLKDSLFVGRGDLAKELEGALSLGSRRPTFLLNGERRMGKTSALKQLPYLLGSRYISVFYNLQGSGIYTSTESFLGILSEGIQREMDTRAMDVKPLQFGLQQTYVPGGPAAYRSFESWLAGVETMLEREQRILLLAFDEFETLEEAEQAKYMDIRLLLNWMRSIIQFHPRIALLFSGTKTFDEMGKQAEIDWTSYFINVQMLRVSFLHVEEARNLITKPTPNFPGEIIFPVDVVETIIAETGCHPFLVQAVCSALITLLNVDRREQATRGDVSKAVEKTLEGWKGHFANLWNRTDDLQRACLEALLVEPRADQQQLALRTGLDEKTVRRAVQTLLRRDLILREQDETYRIAVPIFRIWVASNA